MDFKKLIMVEVVDIDADCRYGLGLPTKPGLICGSEISHVTSTSIERQPCLMVKMKNGDSVYIDGKLGDLWEEAV